MITSPTVFILGAGASIPYGFPSGRNLLLDGTKKLTRGTEISDSLLDLGHKMSFIENFRNELQTSFQPSIGAFVQNRPEYTVLGKHVIAGSLIPYERLDVLLDRSPEIKWYEYLFQHIGLKLEEFMQNKPSIVAFNYDRSLEYFLFYSIKASYKKK